MPSFEPLDPKFSIESQMDITASPVMMVNLCTMDAEDEKAFLSAWSDDALYMKVQPGCIWTQLHRAVGPSPTYLNYALWESVELWVRAFRSEEFQKKLKHHPDSVVFRPHIFQKVAVPDLCTA